jgi:hypothetical protein
LYGHRRGASESGSIMERGRPRKRTDRNNSVSTLRRVESKRSKSEERKAFEQLPKGLKVSEAVAAMNPTDMAALQQQAFGQASRFEVLSKDDVDALSRVRFPPANTWAMLKMSRSFAILTTAQNTSAGRTHLSGPVDATCTPVSASISALLGLPGSAMTPCSSKRKHSLSWIRPSTTG